MKGPDELGAARSTLLKLKSAIDEKKVEIQDFFSSDVGEGQRIRTVYRQIHDDATISSKRIPVRDVNYAIVCYMDEYYPGLLKFTKEIVSGNIDNMSEQKGVILERLSVAATGDKKFIESLFSDLKNPIGDPENLREAIKSLESLIDFLDRLESIKSDIDELSSLKGVDSCETVIADALSLYRSSVSVFMNTTVSTIQKIFTDIEHAVKGDYIKESTTETEETGFTLCD